MHEIRPPLKTAFKNISMLAEKPQHDEEAAGTLYKLANVLPMFRHALPGKTSLGTFAVLFFSFYSSSPASSDPMSNVGIVPPPREIIKC